MPLSQGSLGAVPTSCGQGRLWGEGAKDEPRGWECCGVGMGSGGHEAGGARGGLVGAGAQSGHLSWLAHGVGSLSVCETPRGGISPTAPAPGSFQADARGCFSGMSTSLA